MVVYPCSNGDLPKAINFNWRLDRKVSCFVNSAQCAEIGFAKIDDVKVDRVARLFSLMGKKMPLYERKEQIKLTLAQRLIYYPS